MRAPLRTIRSTLLQGPFAASSALLLPAAKESPQLTDSRTSRHADENCVGLLEWFDEDGKVLLIMELLTGATTRVCDD